MDPEKPSTNPQEIKPINLMVVDDSAFMRFTITEHVNKTNDIRVVGTARDGKEALELIPRLQPDVITLDVEMPNLNGLDTLREIMNRFPRPVIMFSSLTAEGTQETIQALTIGAVDFITKPSNKANVVFVMEEAIAKIRQASHARLGAGKPRPSPQPVPPQPTATPSVSGTTGAPKSTRLLLRQDKVVVIGSSTGGPRALNTVLPGIPGDLPAAYLIVQHMPAGFTRSLAERLDSLSSIRVREATHGDKMEAGLALMAPGGFHMTVDEEGKISLNKNPTVHGVRPSVDITMISAAQIYKNMTIGVILTGMGRDGANGCGLVHSVGGKVIAEDESTCVVWGMPRSVQEAGYADEIVPLPDVSRAIIRAVKG
ncbi:MAG TPA: chemotaxis response regulator protein-glutamate methylesterase [Anaerolineaceae bacterium]